MQNTILDEFWLTSNPIDFEYKKYLLLAYEQKLLKEYQNRKIYPHLTDIVDRLVYVNDFLKNLRHFEDSKMEIERLNWLKNEVVYKTQISDNLFDDVKDTAWYSRDILADLYISFKNLYDEVDGSIVITGNQFSIFDRFSGYLIVKFGKREKIICYEVYKILYPEPTHVLKTYKANMKEYYTDRYNKNIFEIIVNEKYPIKETTIPVIKRKFLLYLLGGYLM